MRSSDDELCDLSAVELRRLVRVGEISPVELLDSCLARIHAANPILNAIVAIDEKRARNAARRAGRAVAAGATLGLLHGLPIGIKDLGETAGLVTTYGSPLFKMNVPARDCGVVARIRAAGGLITAKTNTPEFGAGANTWNEVYGYTANPFDVEKTCGGSSGGSAVALATSMLPLANGSDLGGSLRTPAAYCGVAGLRPTPGVVADETRLDGFSPLSVEGPMARSVEDLALLLSVMSGEDSRDPLSRSFTAAVPGPLAPVDLGALKVACSVDLGFAPVSEQVRRLFRRKSEAFGHLFSECYVRDPDMADASRVFEVLRGVGFLAAHLERVRETPAQVGPNIRANVELALSFTAEDVAWARAERTAIYRRFLTLMDEIDLLIVPATSVQPFAKEQLYPTQIDGRPLETYIHWIAITYGLTLTGHPVLCLPCGTDEDGLPFGLQLVGARFDEARLLAIGAALEQAFRGIEGCARPVPGRALWTS